MQETAVWVVTQAMLASLPVALPKVVRAVAGAPGAMVTRLHGVVCPRQVTVIEEDQAATPAMQLADVVLPEAMVTAVLVVTLVRCAAVMARAVMPAGVEVVMEARVPPEAAQEVAPTAWAVMAATAHPVVVA